MVGLVMVVLSASAGGGELAGGIPGRGWRGVGGRCRVLCGRRHGYAMPHEWVGRAAAGPRDQREADTDRAGRQRTDMHGRMDMHVLPRPGRAGR